MPLLASMVCRQALAVYTGKPAPCLRYTKTLHRPCSAHAHATPSGAIVRITNVPYHKQVRSCPSRQLFMYCKASCAISAVQVKSVTALGGPGSARVQGRLIAEVNMRVALEAAAGGVGVHTHARHRQTLKHRAAGHPRSPRMQCCPRRPRNSRASVRDRRTWSCVAQYNK